MRRTLIKNGIQERINYLVGTNDTDPETPSGKVTIWSAQESMVTNIRRVVKGVVGGNANGKVMSGLTMEQIGQTSSVTVAPGIAFTNQGNIIVLNSTVNKVVAATPTLGQTYAVYIMYGESVASLDDPGAIQVHSSEISGSSTTPINILLDDICSNTNTASILQGQVKIDETLTTENDGAYIGSVKFVAGSNQIWTNVTILPTGQWIDYSVDGLAGVVGFSSKTGTYYYRIDDKVMHLKINISGTSSDNNFLIPVPSPMSVPTGADSDVFHCCRVMNGAAWQTTPGYVYATSANVLRVKLNFASGEFASINTKGCWIDISVPIQ